MRTSLALVTVMILAGCRGQAEKSPAQPLENRSGGIGNGGQRATQPATTQVGRKPGAEREPPSVSSTSAGRPSACRVQDGKAVPLNALRAVGTEPFWGAAIEGRCVTYSHPEDQSGMRIWTRFSGTAEAGRWTGNYQGKPFVLRTRPQADCSDGMSDRRYPIAVALTVSDEERKGCADRV